jgi:hypothetical protein
MTLTKGTTLMRKRLKTITGAAAALVALALGGAAIASATQGTSSAVKHPTATNSLAAEKTTGPDTDKIQSGDQTSPDMLGAKASSAPTPESQTPETGAATETSSETSSASDAPGGHEDPPGNVENQSETQE